jgi:hypothetical protein
MRTSKSDGQADLESARGWTTAMWGACACLALALMSAGALAEEPAAPQREGEDSSGKAWRVAPAKPADTTPKAGVAQRLPAEAVPSDQLRRLGDLKALDVREGEALFRVDGKEQTLRPGMLLKTDRIRSITPQRMVLVRPETVNETMGETLIIIDFLGPGRNRVRMYAARNWTARPLRPVE